MEAVIGQSRSDHYSVKQHFEQDIKKLWYIHLMQFIFKLFEFKHTSLELIVSSTGCTHT